MYDIPVIFGSVAVAFAYSYNNMVDYTQAFSFVRSDVRSSILGHVNVGEIKVLDAVVLVVTIKLLLVLLVLLVYNLGSNVI